MRKSPPCALLVLCLAAACDDGSGGSDPMSEPCVKEAVVSNSGLKASCKAGYSFNKQNMGVLKIDHNMDFAMGCDKVSSTMTSSMMGNLTLDMEETTQKVKLGYAPGSLEVAPVMNKIDSVYVRYSDPANPQTAEELVSCPGLTAAITQLAMSGDSGGKECSTAKQPGSGIVMESFSCPALDAFAKKPVVMNGMMTEMGRAQTGAAHVLARNTMNTLNIKYPKKAQMIAPIVGIIQMLMGLFQQDKFPIKYNNDGNASRPRGMNCPPDAPGCYGIDVL